MKSILKHKAFLQRTAGRLVFVAVLALVFTAFSCMQQKAGAVKSPQGYNLDAPVKYVLPLSLTEISGHTFYKGDPKTIYAQQDEDGKLFYFGFGDKDVKHVKFAGHGDYEDIAICKEQVIILRSDGTLIVFPFSSVRTNQAAAQAKTYDAILPKGEYEGMYGDEKTGLLYILCKTCKGDKKEKATNGYIFSLAANGVIKESGNFSIGTTAIEDLTGKKKLKFAPSALAKNPRTNEWYILSSVNKLLVVADANWNVKQAYPLKASLFPQPEGIAFDKYNNLYISNEGSNLAGGNILKFTYKK
ncbi:MAG: SdiA-regulated family protein [Sphingobacteriales bacterium]|nr:MAG: SdiA-regulated family protein [Sphingobacteriales bacterium]